MLLKQGVGDADSAKRAEDLERSDLKLKTRFYFSTQWE